MQGGCSSARSPACYVGISAAERLFAVLSAYGDMLQKDQDLGDVTRPPWGGRESPTSKQRTTVMSNREAAVGRAR